MSRPPLAFPWEQAIGFGVGVLKLPPQHFWSMTPRELAHAIRAVRGDLAPPITRDEFNALLRAFPDGGHD
jgi:uncharacterized phage protein (TIGR02216 family)